jgi:hypothetical protein
MTLILKPVKAFFLIFIISNCSVTLAAETFEPLFSESQRLKGFQEKQKANKNFDKARESGAADVRKSKAKWDEQQKKAIIQHQIDRKKQKKSVDDTGPEYKADREVRYKKWEAQQARQRQYSEQRKRAREKAEAVKLSPETEYGLDQDKDRADPEKRSLYGKTNWMSKFKLGTTGSGGPTGSSGGSYVPPSYSESAPPPPPAPEFFEPDIPPPPPPPMGDFDEIPPPPIIDDDF